MKKRSLKRFRLQVFDKYVKERAEEERKERKQRAKEAKENFQTLLEEAELSGKYGCFIMSSQSFISGLIVSCYLLV